MSRESPHSVVQEAVGEDVKVSEGVAERGV